MARYIITQNFQKVVTIFSFFVFLKGMTVTKYKKRLFITVIIATIASLITMILVFSFNDFSASGEENRQYVLKSHGDYLALYYGDDIVEVYDNIVISSLPVFDREQFLSGVKINNIEDINEILEDFE